MKVYIEIETANIEAIDWQLVGDLVENTPDNGGNEYTEESTPLKGTGDHIKIRLEGGRD